MTGFERLYKDGHLAIVHGVGYDHPSFSHFSSMAYWHTGAPNSGDAFGWLGRLADGMDAQGSANFLVEGSRRAASFRLAVAVMDVIEQDLLIVRVVAHAGSIQDV